jgi:hypothetical protein
MAYSSMHPAPYALRTASGNGEGDGRGTGTAPLAWPQSASVPGEGRSGWSDYRSHCPVCQAELAPVPGDETVAHRFRHALRDDEARCPLTTLSYQPEGMTIRHMRDVGHESVQRGIFIANWVRHYRAMRQIAAPLTVRRLTQLIECADVANLWSYPGMAQHDVPYVLLVLAGFIRDQGPQGETQWLRFCFDGTVRDVGDLWREGGRAGRSPLLFRMVYRHPGETPYPTSRELMHFRVVERDWSFLEGPDPRALRSDARAFERFLSTRNLPDPGKSYEGADHEVA